MSTADPDHVNHASLADNPATLTRWYWLKPELFVALLAVVTYANSLGNHFCDDGVHIVQTNPLVQEPGHWLDVWTTDHWYESENANPNRDLLYRPLALVSYRLVVMLAGPNAWPQLAINVLLHALICVLIIKVARLVLRSNHAALLSGAIFAVLPIHTEVINNVVGRADMLGAAALLTTLLCHSRVVSATNASVRIRWQCFAAIGVFCSMAAKESSASIVALLPLFHIYLALRKSTTAKQQLATAKSNRIDWVDSIMKLSYVIVPVALYVALRYHALGGVLFQKPALTKTVNVLVDAPVWQRSLGVMQLWGMYWLKTIWPKTLTVNYSINAIRLATSVVDLQVMVGLGVSALLFIVSWRAWLRGYRAAALLVLAMLITYAPTANALVLIQVFFAERIWYLPSIWVAMLAGWGVTYMPRRPMVYVLGVAIIFSMTARCWIRNTQWRNNLTLYASAYQAQPRGIGSLHLFGQELLNRGDIKQAISLIEKAVNIDQGFTDAHRTLGNAYLAAGDLPAAVRHLLIANMQIPGHAITERSLAFAKQRLAMLTDKAIESLKDQAKAQPASLTAQLNLVRKLREIGQLQEALDVLRNHDKTFDRYSAWHHEYAITLVLLNDLDQAIDRYERSIAIDAHDHRTLIELAMLYMERRSDDDISQAQQLADKAYALKPRAAEVLACQAELAALDGNMTKAVELYRKAIESIPTGSHQKAIYQQRAKALGL